MKELHSGDIRSHIIRLSWPMVLVNVFQNAVSMYELYLVGRLGLEALAALGIIMSSVYMLFFSVHGGLINGALALTSRLSGRKDYAGLNSAVVQMLYFSLAVFSVFGAACYIWAGPFLSFFGAKGEVLVQAVSFMRVLAFMFIPAALYSILLAVLRGAGDSITPLWVVVIMIIVNASMNTVLTGMMRIGIKGVAISNLAAWAAGGIAFLFLFMRGIHHLKIRPSDLKPNLKFIKTYAEISLKAILQNFVGDTGTILMLKLIAGYGNAFIAAFGVVMRLVFLLNMFIWPIGNSSGVVTGHSLGGGKRERAMATVVEAIKVIMLIEIPAAVIFMLWPEGLISLFSRDSGVVGYASAYMRILSLTLPLLGAGIVIQAAFNGAGSTGKPTVINFISYIFVRFTLALILTRIPSVGMQGVFWATGVSILVFSVINWIVYRQGKWLDKQI